MLMFWLGHLNYNYININHNLKLYSGQNGRILVKRIICDEYYSSNGRIWNNDKTIFDWNI